jgi:hypothetical protein
LPRSEPIFELELGTSVALAREVATSPVSSTTAKADSIAQRVNASERRQRRSSGTKCSASINAQPCFGISPA